MGRNKRLCVAHHYLSDLALDSGLSMHVKDSSLSTAVSQRSGQPVHTSHECHPPCVRCHHRPLLWMFCLSPPHPPLLHWSRFTQQLRPKRTIPTVDLTAVVFRTIPED